MSSTAPAPAPGGLTPSDFPLAGLTQEALDRLALPPAEIEDLYPLSPMQQGMLFHSLQAESAHTYVTQMSLPVEGLDVARFQEAWQHVIGRHDILRTGFLWEGGLAEPLQVVHRTGVAPVQERDGRAHPCPAESRRRAGRRRTRAPAST